MATSWPNEWTEKLIEYQQAGLSYSQIAAAMQSDFGVPFKKNGIKSKAHRMRVAKDKAPLAPAAKREVSLNSDGSQTVSTLMALQHEPNKDPRTLMTLCGYDPDKFEMISGSYKVYEQHSKQDGTVPQYSISIKVKPIVDVSAAEIVDIMNEQIKPVMIQNDHFGENNLIVPLFDLHFGIATYERYKPMLSRIEQIINHGYKHIVIEIGGDTLHSDFMDKTMTARGTQLDHVDTVKAWQDAKRFVGEVIECSLSNAKHVSIRAISGNHDRDMQWAFVDGLADRYPQVHVHNPNAFRQAFRLDHVGVLEAHGDIALKKLPMLFATEYPEIWANSTWRECHYGHFHHQVVNDDLGVIMRQMGTPKPTDGYEQKNGYTMSSKMLTLFEYDSNRLRVQYYA